MKPLLTFLLTLALVLTVQFVNSRRRRKLERAVAG